MKSLQSIASLWWNEIIFYIKTTQHNRKVQSELQWLTFKMIRWLLEGERKQKKVHLTSQRSSYIETLTAGKIQVHSISKIYKVLSYNVSWRYRRSLHLCAEMLQLGGCTICWSSKPLWNKDFNFPLVWFFFSIFFLTWQTSKRNQSKLLQWWVEEIR